jgi:hypothetical protein
LLALIGFDNMVKLDDECRKSPNCYSASTIINKNYLILAAVLFIVGGILFVLNIQAVIDGFLHGFTLMSLGLWMFIAAIAMIILGIVFVLLGTRD